MENKYFLTCSPLVCTTIRYFQIDELDRLFIWEWNFSGLSDRLHRDMELGKQNARRANFHKLHSSCLSIKLSIKFIFYDLNEKVH